MSTNHTPHFNLSQWEPGDQVLRTEFNENNLKIDAALDGFRTAEQIAEATVEADNINNILLNLAQVNWNRYFALALRLEVAYSPYLRVSLRAYRERCVFLRQDTASTPGGSDSMLLLNLVSHCSVFMPVFYSGDSLPSAIAFGSGNTTQTVSGFAHFSAGGGMTPLKDSGQLVISRTENYFAVGDQFTLWGIK